MVRPLQVELLKLSFGSFTFFPLRLVKILFSHLLLSILEQLLYAQLLLHVQLLLLCELQGLHAVDFVVSHLLAKKLFVVDVLGKYEFRLLLKVRGKMKRCSACLDCACRSLGHDVVLCC